MKIIKTKINYQDKRGVIRDILTHITIDAITYLTSKKGAVRGNHYHKKTIQYEYILGGEYLCATRLDTGGKVSKHILKEGDLAVHPPHEVHTLKALKDAAMLSITKGPRKGFDYEKDTFRLDESLI